VLFGPGGAGKGTLVDRLLERVDGLWLSRSWTTRARRPGEPQDSYNFVDRDTFMDHRDSGGFLEWVELLPDYFMGTPMPDPPSGHDMVLEIDIRGGKQVKERYPDDTVLIMVLSPSREELEARMRRRGDRDDLVQARLELAEREEAEGREVADHVVVNDDLERATAELAGIVEAHRSQES
jgi:guanylate kinase